MPGPLIVVIGLGATGSAALCQLARRDVRAIGIEQFELGHDRGSSHGPTRIFRLAHFENPAYVPLLHRAAALWRELETLSGRKLLVTTGIAELGPHDGALVRGTLAASAAHQLPHEVLDAAALMRRCPAFHASAQLPRGNPTRRRVYRSRRGSRHDHSRGLGRRRRSSLR